MALTRAQLIQGNIADGTILSGQPQGVRPGGAGIKINTDGIIEVDSGTVVGVMKLAPTAAAAATRYNAYTWPSSAGTAGQQLESDGLGGLSWADADGIDWTQKGQLIVGTGATTDILLNVGVNTSTLIADSFSPSGLNYTSAMTTAQLAPAGSNTQRPVSPLAGQFRFNTDTQKFEFYTGAGWEEIASGDPVPGGNTFVKQTIPTNILLETGNALIPSGTTAQRQTLPAPVRGSFRYNTNFEQLEVFDGLTWSQIPANNNFDFVLQTRPAAGFTASAIIPSGNSAQAELPGTPGWLRYNTDFNELQLFNGTDWDLIAPSQGAVSSFVQAAAPVARNVGDIWYNTTLKRESVWDGGAWVQPGVTQTSPTGAALIPFGTTGNQPGSPQEGYLRFNVDFDELECWNGSSWYRIGPSVGTVRSFVQSATPTAVNTGDIWYDTVRERESVWNGAAWVQPGVTQTGPTGAAQLPAGTTGQQPAGAPGLIRYNTSIDSIEFWDAANSTWTPGGGFPAGTRTVFQQTTAPIGWVKDATYNNYAMRIVNGAVGTGGTVGFTTAFSSGLSSGSYTLTTADIPAHSHGVTDPTHFHGFPGASSVVNSLFFSVVGAGGTPSLAGGTASSGTAPIATGISINNTGGDGGHSHTLPDFAVQYVDFIIATKS